MKSPTKEQIDEALFYVSLGMGDNQGAHEEEHRCAELLAVAYRSALADVETLKSLREADYENLVKANARAELAERQYRELCDWLRTCPDMQTESRVVMVIRHERERKELEA